MSSMARWRPRTAGDFDVKYDGVNLPDIVTLGVRQRITDRFRVMAGAEWVELEPLRHRGGQGRPGADRAALRVR